MCKNDPRGSILAISIRDGFDLDHATLELRGRIAKQSLSAQLFLECDKRYISRARDGEISDLTILVQESPELLLFTPFEVSDLDLEPWGLIRALNHLSSEAEG